jgi:hypothetical protein
MARKLARDSGAERSDRSDGESSEESGKWVLNRRNCVKLGGASIASLLIGGASGGVSTGSAEADPTYWTNFSSGGL